jgi:hypothetical protein
VSGIRPVSGPAGGGTSVTIAGSGFTGATKVQFGSANAHNFTVNGANQITAISPPGSGNVDVTVTTAAGTSAKLPADRFTYLNPNCTLKPRSKQVSMRATNRHPKPAPPSLALTAKCDQPARVMLTGTVTELLGKHRTKHFKLHAVAATVRPGVADVLKIKIPPALLTALQNHVKESATFALTIGGKTAATAMIRSLKP